MLRTKTRVSNDAVRGKGRLYSVDNVQFAGTSEEEFLQATMTINAYRFGGAAAAAATPAGAPATASTSAAPATTP